VSVDSATPWCWVEVVGEETDADDDDDDDDDDEDDDDEFEFSVSDKEMKERQEEDRVRCSGDGEAEEQSDEDMDDLILTKLRKHREYPGYTYDEPAVKRAKISGGDGDGGKKHEQH
jgi:hypothetical protein